jgi:hypothetical protein
MVRLGVQLAKPPHAILYPRPLHRLHPRLCLGHRDADPPWLDPPLRPLCRLHRPLLRRRLHRRRLRAARHRQGRLLKLHRRTHLHQPRPLWLFRRQQQFAVGGQHQQELRDAQGVVGVWHHEHDLLLHHVHLGAVPAPASQRRGRGEGKGGTQEPPQQQTWTFWLEEAQQQPTELLCLK